MNGFGDYLRKFFGEYEAYFNGYVEEHALMYTQLHRQFSENLQLYIDGWLHAKGLSEEDFGSALSAACSQSDDQSDEIIGILIGMLDYERWIGSIFDLKRDQRVKAVLLPSSQCTG